MKTVFKIDRFDDELMPIHCINEIQEMVIEAQLTLPDFNYTGIKFYPYDGDNFMYKKITVKIKFEQKHDNKN